MAYIVCVPMIPSAANTHRNARWIRRCADKVANGHICVPELMRIRPESKMARKLSIATLPNNGRLSMSAKTRRRMPMNGKNKPANSRILNAEESAARFLTERGGNALCLCADDSAAALLRGTIAQTADAPIKLQVISWRQLCAAANALPENQPPDKLFAAAALLPSAGGRWQLNAKIYAQLSAAQKENGGMRLADSLAQLFEEMQECGVFDKPAADKLSLDGNFAYQAKLLDDVRRALAKETDDKELITIAKTLTQPLLFVCANDIAPTPAQRRFIDNAQNAKVFCGNPSAEEKHLREVLSADGAKTPGDITCRHLADYAALSLADAARAALMVVRDFLENENQHCGNPKIGIVVYDRLLARRLRALAENDGILIADRAGWRAATLSCGAALATAAAAVAAPFDTADAESLLQPPFWQALKDEQHNAMLEEWREVLDSAKALPESWGEVATLCAEGSALQQAARRFDIGGRESMTTGEWLRFLRDTFAPLLSGYDEDKAALEMFARLQTAGGDSAMCAGEFCAWLNLFLRDESFAGDDIDSPVVFVPPQVNTSASGGGSLRSLITGHCSARSRLSFTISSLPAGTSSSATMASTGHSGTHKEQSMHSSGSITSIFGPS